MFFLGGILPEDPFERDLVLVRVLGGVDPYRSQIDGLGGGTSSTSKAVIVSPSERPDIDVDFLFGQVGIDSPNVDWRGSCGNLASAVGPFAIEEGLVTPSDPVTTVRIFQTNTSRLILAHIPTKGGVPVVDGTFRIDGVANSGSEIRLDFLDPAGSVTGQLLPTGNVFDQLDIEGWGKINATLVDAGIACILLAADDLGLAGNERADDLNRDSDLLCRLEAVRAAGAVAMGLARTPQQASQEQPNVPKVALVSPPSSYGVPSGSVHADDVDLVARLVSMGRVHHALSVTGSIAIAAAAELPGSMADRARRRGDAGILRVGHAAGVIRLEVDSDGPTVKRVSLSRTARRLMEGNVLIPWGLQADVSPY